jgi:hypothetical protein
LFSPAQPAILNVDMEQNGHPGILSVGCLPPPDVSLFVILGFSREECQQLGSG